MRIFTNPPDEVLNKLNSIPASDEVSYLTHLFIIMEKNIV